MKKSVLIIFGLAAIIIIGTLLATTLRHRRDGAASALADKAVAVQTQTVAKGTISESLHAAGTVAADVDVVVSAEIGGRATQVAINIGDRVSKGETLVQVDDELKAIALEQARAQWLAAETLHKKSARDLERAEKLQTANGIADADVENARLGLAAAEAQWKAAQAGFKLAQRQLDDCRIKAPVSGVVAAKYVEVGEMVTPGRQIANIVDLSRIKIAITVREEDIVRVRLNQPVRVFLDAAPQTAYQGLVHSVGAKSTQFSSHNYPVEILVQHPDLALFKVGMFARAQIQTSTVSDAVIIDKEALLDDGQSSFVYIVEKGRAVKRSVRTGIRHEKNVQIVSGLNAGDLLVTFGQSELQNGVHVKTERGLN
jgi:RND family efflux transporter MFP subunit